MATPLQNKTRTKDVGTGGISSREWRALLSHVYGRELLSPDNARKLARKVERYCIANALITSRGSGTVLT